MSSRDDVTRTYRKTTVTEMKWIWASEYSLSLFGMGETLNEYRMVYAWWMPAIKTSENAGTVSVCWLQVMMHGVPATERTATLETFWLMSSGKGKSK
jgi:hypothetical protein